MKFPSIWLGSLLAGAAAPVFADTSLSETFDQPLGWQELLFPSITNHSTYTIINDGSNRYLEAHCDRSASGLVCTNVFDVDQYPSLSWRWKVSNVYTNLDETTKAGDDYPIRLYVAFESDPGRVSLLDRLANTLYGELPPHSSLNYVWASRTTNGARYASPYTSRTRMIVKESGADRTGVWINVSVNILDDYRASFGKDPPRLARLAVMSDSDNAGQAATACVDDFVVAKP